MRLEIFDKDTISKDDPMGMVDVDVSSGGFAARWIVVRACKGCAKPTGQLEVQLVSRAQESQSARSSRALVPPPPPRPPPARPSGVATADCAGSAPGGDTLARLGLGDCAKLAAGELAQSELHYLEDLQTLREVFVEPLRAALRGAPLQRRIDFLN